MTVRSGVFNAAVLGAVLGAAAAVGVPWVYSRYAPPEGVSAPSPASVPPPSTLVQPEELIRTQAERDWFRYFYSYYGSMTRLLQYGIADSRSAVYAGAIADFVTIPRVTSKVYCPKPSDGLVGKDTLYYASRVTILPRSGRPPLIYAVDYHGSGTFAYGKASFDTLFAADDPRPGPVVKMTATDARGLFASVIGAVGDNALSRNGGYFAPFSISSVDVNGDGVDDFTLGGRLMTSEGGTFVMSPDPTFDGREVLLARHRGMPVALVPNGSAIDVYRLAPPSAPALIASIDVGGPFADDRAYVMLPLNGALLPEAKLALLVLLKASVELHAIDDDLRGRRLLATSTLQPGEVMLGARGDFTGDGVDDVWLAEQKWKNAAAETVGRALLLSSTSIRQYLQSPRPLSGIEALASTTLYGSRRYTDYDGIGASLSPIAGDIDGDGRPDLSFPGHRHLSEAGAFFVLPGAAVRAGVMVVDDPVVIRIAGQPVSQVGPPFVHWDATDVNGDRFSDVILPVDNDICAGLNAGAIYLLDGRRIVEAKARIR